MNRRISRLALLVVLLVSMLGVFQGGNTLSRLVLAQGESCDIFAGYQEIRGTPQADLTAGSSDEEPINYVIESIFRTPENSNSDLEQTLIQLTLMPAGEISILPDATAIIRVDSGGVTLWNCGETSMEVQLAGSSEPIIVEPGQSQEVDPDGAIYVESDDVYYVAEGISGGGDASPAAGVQQLNKELSIDSFAASNLQDGGSRLTIGVAQTYKLCSKGGC